MSRNSARGTLTAAVVLLMLATFTGCRPDNIFFTIKNTSGGTLHDVKVTYPGGQLKLETLDNSTISGTFRHFDGPGDLAVSYSTEDGHNYGSSGPRVTGNEKGEVEISIEGSYSSFDTKFDEGQQ